MPSDSECEGGETLDDDDDDDDAEEELDEEELGDDEETGTPLKKRFMAKKN